MGLKVAACMQELWLKMLGSLSCSCAKEQAPSTMWDYSTHMYTHDMEQRSARTTASIIPLNEGGRPSYN